MVAATWRDDGRLAKAWWSSWGDESDDAIPELPHQRRPQRLTKHARKRAARRNVASDAVEYVLDNGRIVQRTGVMFYFLGRRDIPLDDRSASWAARLEGTTVLVAPDGAVVTLYRNRRGLRTIMRKLKYRLPEYDRRPAAASMALTMIDMDQAIA